MQDTRQVSEPWVGYPGYGQAPEPVGRASQLRAGILAAGKVSQFQAGAVAVIRVP